MRLPARHCRRQSGVTCNVRWYYGKRIEHNELKMCHTFTVYSFLLWWRRAYVRSCVCSGMRVCICVCVYRCVHVYVCALLRVCARVCICLPWIYKYHSQLWAEEMSASSDQCHTAVRGRHSLNKTLTYEVIQGRVFVPKFLLMNECGIFTTIIYVLSTLPAELCLVTLVPPQQYSQLEKCAPMLNEFIPF